MSKKLSTNTRMLITATTTLLVLSHIAYDYFNGGVPTHFIFQSDLFPGLSNWLGVAILPALTWILLIRINKRLHQDDISNVIFRFIAALLVGIVLSFLFTKELPGIDYIMLGLFGVALFTPLYKSEYLFGYVLGTGFTFGVAIPTIFGSLLLAIYAFIYWTPRWVINKIKRRNSPN